MIEGITAWMLRDCVAAREKIDAEAETIYGLANLLGTLRCAGEDSLTVDPAALAHVFGLVERSTLLMADFCCGDVGFC